MWPNPQTYFMNMTITNFTYDTTPYACGEKKQAAISEFQSLAFRLFKWFENKHTKAHPGKSHFLLSNNKTKKVTIKYVVLNSNVEEELL